MRPLLDQEEGVEHNRFRKSNRQDGLNQNFRGGHGITSNCLRSAHSDQSNADGSAQRRQTNMQAPANMIVLILSRRLPRLNTVKPTIISPSTV